MTTRDKFMPGLRPVEKIAATGAFLLTLFWTTALLSLGARFFLS